MKNPTPLPPEIIAALIYVRTKFGRKAKGLIRDAWIDGNYWFAREHDGALQCLRNYYGGAPTLARITMAAL